VKRGLSFSRGVAASAALALAAAAAMFGLKSAVGSRALEARRIAALLQSDLSGRIAAQSGCGDRDLQALREQVGLFRRHLGQEGSWGRIVQLLGKRWTVEGRETEEGKGYSTESGAFRMLSPAVADWPGIVEAVGSLETMPGAGIIEFRMKSSGSRELRSLDTVKIVVSVRTRRAGAEKGGP